MGISHIPIDFRLGHKSRHGVHDDDVNGTAPHQCLHDVQGLFPRVRLGDEQFIDVNAQLLGIDRVQSVLRINKRRNPPCLLRLRNHVQGDRGLARRLRPIDLDNPSPRNPSDA